MTRVGQQAVTAVSGFSALLGGSRMERLATASVYLVLVYVLNLMFFFPFGESYLIPVLLLSALLCLGYRKTLSCWSASSVKALLLPMLLYTSVLVASYLINGGFMSTIRMFLYCSLFIYAASVVRLKVSVLGVLCAVAAAQMVILVIYRCVWLECERFGGFTNPIFFGMFSVCMAIVSVYLASAFGSRWRAWVLYASSLVFCLAAGLTLTRGVIIALIPVFLIFAVYLYVHRVYSARKALIAMFVATCLAAGIGAGTGFFERFGLVDEQLLPALSDEADDDAYRSSVGFRILMWKYALAVTEEHPIFGAGKERFQQYKKEWVEQGRFPEALINFLSVSAHTHNQYFQELAMRGLIGFSALLALLIVPAIRFFRMARSRYENVEWAGYIGLNVVLAYAIFGLTEVALKHPEKIAVFAIVSFLALSIGKVAPATEGETA